ncbi:MAG: hypothetical protein NZ928_02195 [Endomicrobia bacterium]|nr:hypothetical protein [Endomicrobiia bacterium]MCX7940291.1 hypothetical protein [Endomicrobiia bacterium]MDW8055805.1 hypothetical protein [Elusimicrobiota bacterium]
MKIDLNKKWEEAIKNTKIIRSRYSKLETFKKTVVPYVLVNKSLVNKGSTVIREGTVEVSPAIIHLPYSKFELHNFKFKETTEYSDEIVKSFLLIRGVQLPSMRYSNSEIKLEVVDKPLEDVIKEYQELFQRKEDIDTGLILSLPDIWQFSLIIYLASLVIKSAENDIKTFMDLLNE